MPLSDHEDQDNRVPSLVWFAQRVAVKYLDSIDGFGDDLGRRYDLLNPILRRCSAEELFKVEINTPTLERCTQELWQSLCSKAYPLETQKCLSGEEDYPHCWRTHYVVLQERAKERLEAVGSKMRNQRLALESHKKEREVKLTDCAPPSTKRSRGWGWAPAPKTLMQKTVSTASKLQRSVYQAPFAAKKARVLPQADAFPLLAAPRPFNPNATVKSVKLTHPIRTPQRPLTSSSTSTTPSISPPPTYSSSSCDTPTRPAKRKAPTSDDALPMLTRMMPESPPDPRPLKRQKKDPMAALFLPRDRAYSQRPTAAR